MKIFGREPAFWLGIIQAFLALLLTFNSVAADLRLTDERVGVIMALLFAAVGVAEAWLVRDTIPAALNGLAKAVIALLAAYNFELSPDQIAGVLAVVALLADAVFLRDRTSPLVSPSFRSTPSSPVLTAA